MLTLKKTLRVNLDIDVKVEELNGQRPDFQWKDGNCEVESEAFDAESELQEERLFYVGFSDGSLSAVDIEDLKSMRRILNTMFKGEK